jgi:hypothetical protein
VGADQTTQALLGIGYAFNGGALALMSGFQTVQNRRREQILLAAKMVERATRTHADGFGDIPRRRRVEALFNKQTGGGA